MHRVLGLRDQGSMFYVAGFWRDMGCCKHVVFRRIEGVSAGRKFCDKRAR